MVLHADQSYWNQVVDRSVAKDVMSTYQMNSVNTFFILFGSLETYMPRGNFFCHMWSEVKWIKSQKELKYCFHVDGQKLPICQKNFLDTLCISDQMVHTTLTKMTYDGHLLAEGRKPPASHRLPESTREAVRNHVSKFQTVPSHYCRHTSSKQYLPESLTLTEMYRMYAMYAYNFDYFWQFLRCVMHVRKLMGMFYTRGR